MAECRNGFPGCKNFVTNRTMLAFSKPRCGTGGGNSRIRHFGMPEGRGENGLTYRAGLCLGAGCSRTVGMAVCGDFVLFSAKLHITNRAVYYRIKRSLICTGRRNIVFNNCFRRSMPKSSNGFLCGKNRITYRAILTFGKPRCGAGGCHGRFNGLCMAESRNNVLRHKNFIANRAVFAFGKPGCGTGWRNSGIDRCGVAEGGKFCICCIITHCAVFICFPTTVFAICRLCIYLNKGVTAFFNFFLRCQNFSAYSAFASFGKPRCGAGGFFCRHNNRCVL